MATTPRGNSWQSAFSRAGQRYRKSFASKAEADQWERDTLTILAGGGAVSVDPASVGKVRTMQQLLDSTYERYWRDQKSSENSYDNGQRVVDILGKDRPVNTVTNGVLDSLITDLRKGGSRGERAGGTVNRHIAALSKMLRHAVRLGVITHAPRIERLRESEHRIRWLTADEEKELLDRLKFLGRDTMVDYVKFLVDTGLRGGEALNVRWDHLQDGNVHVWGFDPNTKKGSKNSSSRTVPLTARVKVLIEQRKADCPAGEDRLWWNLDYWTANSQWRHVREALGKQDDQQYVMHMLRHTFCSRLVQRGVGIATVRELAGHKTLAVTLRYAHLAPRNLSEAISVLEPA